jgi:MFS transporter, FHS family, L-fucose permease
MSQRNAYFIPFILITSLFFMWGIANNLNGILIPHLRKALQLSNMQSTFVDTAVYLAYFLSAIPAGILLKKFGYKKGIIVGLLVFAAGAFLFLPAASMRAYEVFLIGLFILGCGLTILETAANPYATRLGAPESATARLNLAQSFNGLAVFIAPVLGTIFILSGKEFSKDQLLAMPEVEKIAYLSSEADSVKMPYLILGGFLVKWAVIAQLFYVGAQVCVTSFFIRMAMSGGGVDEKTAGYYLGTYGLLFMIGRFAGTFIMRYVEPARLLSIYTVVCILLSAVAVFAAGQFVVLALGGLGFFMSIMFPTIFSLGIVGLKEDTKPASSLIVMAIIGGAVFPVIMGKIIDSSGDNIQMGYIVPFVCYFFVLYFGLVGHKVKNV